MGNSEDILNMMNILTFLLDTDNRIDYFFRLFEQNRQHYLIHN